MTATSGWTPLGCPTSDVAAWATVGGGGGARGGATGGGRAGGVGARDGAPPRGCCAGGGGGGRSRPGRVAAPALAFFFVCFFFFFHPSVACCAALPSAPSPPAARGPQTRGTQAATGVAGGPAPDAAATPTPARGPPPAAVAVPVSQVRRRLHRGRHPRAHCALPRRGPHWLLLPARRLRVPIRDGARRLAPPPPRFPQRRPRSAPHAAHRPPTACRAQTARRWP